MRVFALRTYLAFLVSSVSAPTFADAIASDPTVTASNADLQSAYCVHVIGAFVEDIKRRVAGERDDEKKKILLDYQTRKEIDRDRVKESVIDKLNTPGVWEALNKGGADILANFDARVACAPACKESSGRAGEFSACIDQCSASEVTRKIRSCDSVNWLQ
ncbi:hypothetical protein [Variovorax paradoxus]|uniref:DUF1311 domain-containing protein n=1 Tax=Variovorax paradoxus TaxID=34073 RepID=A0A6I6HFX4_VARPD|nr:hypothetical protein [Variovorax paradoxus]QGW80385.1 hypothetical protein GOQ09_01710 [Variovorax paradoxus]